MSEQKYPRARQMPGSKTWHVEWAPLDASGMPSRLHAERCVLAEQMEGLLREWEDDVGTGDDDEEDGPFLGKRTRALLKRLDDARERGEGE